MCVGSMEVRRYREEVKPRAWRFKGTKWSPRKCYDGEGDKQRKKRKRTARKSRRSGAREACDKSSCWIRFARRYKVRSVSPSMKSKDGGNPFGTMAPKNTTQYLMHEVYQDLVRENEMFSSVNMSSPTDFSGHDQGRSIYGDFVSPQNVYICLDSIYESTLEFQQRDFENVFNLYDGAQ